MNAGSSEREATTDAQTDAGYRLILLMVIGTSILLIWVLPLASSLWIDELGTFWVIEGGVAQATERAWEYQGQSPLYYLTVWSATAVLGTSEIVLRIPSLMFMLGSTVLVYMLGREWFGERAAVFATAAFVVTPTIAQRAADARPYAMAIFAVLVSTWYLARWYSAPTRTRAIVYGVSAATVVYIHYVFATVLVAHALFVLVVAVTDPDRRRELIRDGALALGAFSILVLPLAGQASALLRRKSELTFTPMPDIASVIAFYQVPLLTLTLAVVALIWAVRHRASHRQVQQPVTTTPLFTLAWVGALVPPLCLLLLARVGGVILWTDRYLMPAMPFMALTFGFLVGRLVLSEGLMTWAVVGMLSVGILTMASDRHTSEDWQGAIATVDSILDDRPTPVLMVSGLVEADSERYLEGEVHRSYLTSPVSYYRLTGNVVPLPNPEPDDRASRFLRHADRDVRDSGRFVYVGQGSAGELGGMILSTAYVERGYAVELVERNGTITIWVFERD